MPPDIPTPDNPAFGEASGPCIRCGTTEGVSKVRGANICMGCLKKGVGPRYGRSIGPVLSKNRERIFYQQNKVAELRESKKKSPVKAEKPKDHTPIELPDVEPPVLKLDPEPVVEEPPPPPMM